MTGLVATALLLHRLSQSPECNPNLRIEGESCHGVPRPYRCQPESRSYLRSAVYEPDDVLDCLHCLRGDDLCARSALGEHGVDVDRIGHQPLHFGIYRPELCDRELNKRALEG